MVTPLVFQPRPELDNNHLVQGFILRVHTEDGLWYYRLCEKATRPRQTIMITVPCCGVKCLPWCVPFTQRSAFWPDS